MEFQTYKILLETIKLDTVENLGVKEEMVKYYILNLKSETGVSKTSIGESTKELRTTDEMVSNAPPLKIR